jgi:sphingosine kinase
VSQVRVEMRLLTFLDHFLQVSYRKVLGYRIIPHKREGVEEEYISVDGERIPFGPFQAEVHGGLGTVLARGPLYEAPGV